MGSRESGSVESRADREKGVRKDSEEKVSMKKGTAKKTHSLLLKLYQSARKNNVDVLSTAAITLQCRGFRKGGRHERRVETEGMAAEKKKNCSPGREIEPLVDGKGSLTENFARPKSLKSSIRLLQPTPSLVKQRTRRGKNRLGGIESVSGGKTTQVLQLGKRVSSPLRMNER